METPSQKQASENNAEEEMDVKVIGTNDADNSWDGVVTQKNDDGSTETVAFRMYDMSSYFRKCA